MLLPNKRHLFTHSHQAWQSYNKHKYKCKTFGFTYSLGWVSVGLIGLVAQSCLWIYMPADFSLFYIWSSSLFSSSSSWVKTRTRPLQIDLSLTWYAKFSRKHVGGTERVNIMQQLCECPEGGSMGLSMSCEVFGLPRKSKTTMWGEWLSMTSQLSKSLDEAEWRSCWL